MGERDCQVPWGGSDHAGRNQRSKESPCGETARPNSAPKGSGFIGGKKEKKETLVLHSWILQLTELCSVFCAQIGNERCVLLETSQI